MMFPFRLAQIFVIVCVLLAQLHVMPVAPWLIWSTLGLSIASIADLVVAIRKERWASAAWETYFACYCFWQAIHWAVQP